MVSVVGARPQFVKAAAISNVIRDGNYNIQESIIHTGQHYDANMSDIFFDGLGIPSPIVNLGVGSGAHGLQTGKMMELIEKNLQDMKPDCLLVYGDTNSTLAASLVAAKSHIPCAHVEAGVRTYDRKAPEEINRVVADHVSQILFCSSNLSVENLRKEGIVDNVYNCGDIMLDTFNKYISISKSKSSICEVLGLAKWDYYLATIHRPRNTDNKDNLFNILKALEIADKKVIFPMHPRTRAILADTLIGENIIIMEPVPYLDLLALESNADLIITDSGGIQKEAYWSHVPCIIVGLVPEWAELEQYGYSTLSKPITQDILKSIDRLQKNRHMLRYKDGIYGVGESAKVIIDTISKRFAHA